MHKYVVLAFILTMPSLCRMARAQGSGYLPNPGSAAPCPSAASLSDLVNVTCSRGDFTVTYPGPGYILSCTATGGAPLLSADDISVISDPGGPNAVLFGASPWGTSWSVRPGQKLECTINFTVTSPLGETGLAQEGTSATGDAYVHMANDVYTSPKTISSLTCVATSCPGDNWNDSFIHFIPGTYAADLTFTLNGAAGRGGTATLLMISEHF